MAKGKTRSSRQERPSPNQRSVARPPQKSHWRKPVLLSTLGAAVTAVIIGVIVNVLSTQAQRVVPPPSSPSASTSPHLEVDGVNVTSSNTQVKGSDLTLIPFKVDIKVLNTGKGVAAINDAKLVIQSFVKFPLCASQGSFSPTGEYRSNMPTNAKPGQVVNVPISQLVQPNGADRFLLLLRVPLPKGSDAANIYVYRAHLYLTYNVHTKPLNAGEVLVDLPVWPVAGEYYWNSYYATHPQAILGAIYKPDIPKYKSCAMNNSRALRSILSQPAIRPAQLAAILPQLRY